MKVQRTARLVWVFGISLIASVAHAQQPGSSNSSPRQPDPARIVQQVLPADYKAADGLSFNSVTIISGGVTLHGEASCRRHAAPSKRPPAIVKANSWGGKVVVAMAIEWFDTYLKSS